MKESRGIREHCRRYAAFVVSLFILALGVALTLRADLGSSPISCPPYVLSRAPQPLLSIGGYIFCMQFFFVLAQIILLRKDFQKIQLLQLAVCLIFGTFTDVAMFLTEPLQWGGGLSGYLLRWLQLAFGGAILGIGVAWEVRCDVLMIPGEGLPATIARVFRIDFGKVKIAFDVTLVAAAVALCYFFWGRWRWDMVGFGTLFSMFYVGFIVRLVNPHMRWLDNWLCAGRQRKTRRRTMSGIIRWSSRSPGSTAAADTNSGKGWRKPCIFRFMTKAFFTKPQENWEARRNG